MTLEREEEVRRWYHRFLPGGMPADWLADTREYGGDFAMARDAATLALTHRLHAGCGFCQTVKEGR